MPKAYRVLLKVHSAEVKQDKDAPLAAEPFCKIEYGTYRFQTQQRVDPEGKTPQWKDQFELTYFDKAPVVFRLLSGAKKDGAQPTELCKGELDLAKRIGNNGETEVTLKTADGKKDKSAGLLKVSLQWLGDFDLVPFRLELILHTVEAVRRKELGACKVRVRLGPTDEMMTKTVNGNKEGKYEFKERSKFVVTTHEEAKIELLGTGMQSGPSCTLSMDTLRKSQPGVVKKLYLMEEVPHAEDEIVEKGAEKKMQRRGVIWVVINHNYRHKVDPKESGIIMAEEKPSPAQMKATGQQMSKSQLRKWVYEEFKPQKNKKMSLKTMSDLQKSGYLANQQSSLTKLQAHRESLRDHLEILEDKLDDTLAKMREKQKTDKKVSKEERERKAAMDEKFNQMRALQAKADKLKEAFTGGSAFDKLKDLENVKGLKTKRVAQLKKEVDSLQENNEARQNKLEEIEQKNAEEVGRVYTERKAHRGVA